MEPPKATQYVALCTSSKEDHEALREWILYHACIGVGKFYIYDDGSTEPMLEKIIDFV